MDIHEIWGISRLWTTQVGWLGFNDPLSQIGSYCTYKFIDTFVDYTEELIKSWK